MKMIQKLTMNYLPFKVLLMGILTLASHESSAQYTLKKVSTGATYGTTLGGFSFVSDQIGFHVAGNRILKTVDAGETWTTCVNVVSSATGSGADYAQGCFVTENIGWVVQRKYDNVSNMTDSCYLHKTTDGGATWTLQLVNPPNTVEYGAALFSSVYFKDELEGWVFGNGLLEHTTDGGATWTIITHYIGDVSNHDVMRSMHFNSAGIGYIVGYGSWIQQSTDGGNTWNTQHYYPGNFVTDDYYIYDVAFENQDTGYVSIGNGFFKRTFDGGATWTDMETGFEHDNNGAAMGPENSIWFSSGDFCNNTGCYYSSSLMYSEDYGTTWTALVDTMENNPFYDVVWPTDQYGFACTRRGEIFKIEKSSASLSANANDPSVKVYPNPSTNVLFVEHTNTYDRMEIRDLTGRVVYENDNLQNEQKIQVLLEGIASGSYSLRLLGTNKSFNTKILVQ